MATATPNNSLVAVSTEKQAVIDQFAAYAHTLEQLAVQHNGKWVVAGYTAGCPTPEKHYCYCGMGKGYMGAPIVPANSTAVVFESKAEAQRIASQLKYTNGRRERIILEAKPANEYFWLLYDHVCSVTHDLILHSK
jgi:hypothetical protein